MNEFQRKVMNSLYCKVLVIIGFNIFLIFSVKSQDTSLVSSAYIASGELVRGDLLIMLQSHRKKLEALDEEFKKGDVRYKKKVQNLIAKITKDRDSFNLALMKAMKEHYSFSKVYFFYDHDFYELQKSNFIGGRFLSTELKKGFTRPYSNRPYYILKHGRTNTQSLEAYVLYDKHERVVPKPFPSTIRINNFTTWKNHIIFPDEANKRDADYFAKKLQKTYRKIYEHYYADTFQ